MHWFSVGVASLAAVAIMAVGALYLIAPIAMSRSFGLQPPGDRSNIAWWLRLKGTRDTVSGLIVLAVLAWASRGCWGSSC